MRSDASERIFAMQWRALALFLLLIGAASAYWLHQNREELTERERHRLLTQARVVELNLSSQLEAGYRALYRIRADLPQWRVPAGYTHDATQRLQAIEEALPGLRALAILDAGGTVRAASSDQPPGDDAYGRQPHFGKVREDNSPEVLYLSPPFRTPLGDWTMSMSIAVADGQGRFAGTVTGILEPDYYKALLASVGYVADFRAGMAHGDGAFFLESPATAESVGKQLNRPGSMFNRHQASGEDSTVFSGTIAVTGERRMIAQQTVRPPTLSLAPPPIVAVSRDLAAIYRPWWNDVRTSATLYLLIVGCNIVGLHIYQRRTRKLNEEALAARAETERLAERNQLLLDSAGEGIFGVDLGERCLFINPAALALLGFAEAREVLDHSAHALFHYQHGDGSPYPAAECPISLTLADGLRRRVEDVFTCKDGRLVPVQMTVTPLLEDDRIVGAEVVFQDISKRREMERELIRLATTDMLTGIANRRRFMEQLGMELQRIKRFGKPATLLMLDIDFFKQVNDNYGHAAGDAVLCRFAGLAQGSLRRIDLFGRLGGEEFGILLPGTALAGALDFAERLRQQVAQTPVPAGDDEIRITVSIGAAEFDTADPAPDSILARADAALYRAKDAGRNRVEAG